MDKSISEQRLQNQLDEYLSKGVLLHDIHIIEDDAWSESVQISSVEDLQDNWHELWVPHFKEMWENDGQELSEDEINSCLDDLHSQYCRAWKPVEEHLKKFNLQLLFTEEQLRQYLFNYGFIHAIDVHQTDEGFEIVGWNRPEYGDGIVINQHGKTQALDSGAFPVGENGQIEEWETRK